MAAAATNTTPHISSKSPTIRRILREAAEISNSPSPDYAAEPLESDLFEWHFTLRGPPNSVYSQGLYHGRILLPPTYPLRPPSFRFTTPNGRFEANREICLSISGHHEETWQPAWGIRTAIVALRSFMETDARGQLGGVDTTDMIRRRLAQESGPFRCQTCARSNAQIIADAEERARQSSAAAEDVQIPQELSMGWRDEMEASKKAKSGPGAQPESSNTAPSRLSDSDDASPLPAPLPPSQPTVRHPQRQRQAARPAHPNNGVPLWIDRAIVALAVVLAAMLLRVFLRM
ncbi:ubiquitin-conjugating enzyme [Hirsutella rhossiliensis]|uniref:Ubiquitin-conjugating enzyme domain-containing protein n=1 Tax=Hirsutella rhossiliensis TaxID=111463 RepID=A0A9P8N582_9HYPO|nr:ubiquitin-conjugating enzyme domain-containing protein [Hirsutella rhossiliensis]KAH0964872.1 ubiquitin-conjugating enzyme domain-containing protein [Hirsutella rhossiliensis]